jgi:hypothetical protein
MQLWQIYLNNVDALLKVLHIPTTQSVTFAAVNNPEQVPADVSALLFSIYVAAVITLQSADTNFILGQDRQSALLVYQRGLEIFLHAASFFDSPSTTSLQAILI